MRVRALLVVLTVACGIVALAAAVGGTDVEVATRRGEVPHATPTETPEEATVALEAAPRPDRVPVTPATPTNPTARASTQDRPAASTPAAPSRTRHVRLLGPGDIPLAGVRFDARNAYRRSYVTDEDGEAALDVRDPVHPVDPVIEVSEPLPDRKVRLRDELTVVRFPDVLPLTVRTRDALTGEPLDVERVSLSRTVLLRATGPGTYTLPFGPPDRSDYHLVWLRTTAKPGGAAPRTRLYVRASPFARATRIDVPVWPTIDVAVQVLRHDGSPATNAVVEIPVASGVKRSVNSQRCDADGRVRIDEVLAVPGEYVVVDATVPDRNRVVSVGPVKPDGAPLQATVRLPERPNSQTSGSRGYGCGGGYARIGWQPRPPPRGSNRLTVRMRRDDGRVASGVRMRAWHGDPSDRSAWQSERRTDRSGRVVFENLPDGEAQLLAWAPGTTPVAASTTIDATRPETLHAELQAPAGGVVWVRVVDHDNNPVPHARVDVEVVHTPTWTRWQHAVLDEDAHVLDPRTDMHGRLVVDRVGADCRLDVSVEFGSRSAKASVTAGEQTVVVRLPPADLRGVLGSSAE